MNKALAVAVLLLAALALAFAASNTPVVNFAGPRVIAKVNLTHHTAKIPTTTIFTPPQTGLYRASAYMMITTPVSGEDWAVPLSCNAEVGAEKTVPPQL